MAGFKDKYSISEDISNEIRPVLEIERDLEKVDRKERSLLIKLLSEGNFDQAENKADKVFEDRSKYYEFVANVAELLQSRHVQRALNHHNRAFNESNMYHMSIESLEKAKKNIKKAEKEMVKAKRIMNRYSHKFHEIKDHDDKFEELVENFNDNKERLKKLEEIQSQFEGI